MSEQLGHGKNSPSVRVLGDPTFLDPFAELRKTIITSVMSVCLSVYLYVCLSVRPSSRLCVRMVQLEFHCTNFYEILYVNIV